MESPLAAAEGRTGGTTGGIGARKGPRQIIDGASLGMERYDAGKSAVP
jgi:hypothetical protein